MVRLKMDRTQDDEFVHIHEIPDVILSNIFSLITDTRTRNSLSLVCLKWHLIERATRTSLTLRGNIRDLLLLPTCFRAVNDLDLSLLSPWGHSIFDSVSPLSVLLAQLFKRAFPSVVSLTVYARNPSALRLLALQWNCLRNVKLIRWHQRSPALPGSDFVAWFEHNPSITSLDLSNFYCWTEDLPPALAAYPCVAANLAHLNILTHPSAEGFKSNELIDISSACPNLRGLLATCVFHCRMIGFVGDETLLSLASNCPRLSLLHLVDSSSSRGDPDDEEYSSEDAKISHAKLINVFAELPLLEELVLDVCHNVRDTWPALEMLNSRCPRLKSLKLGHFHGICRGIYARPDGISLCSKLQSLSIKNCADLTDSGLIAISFGCPKLSKFEVESCRRITEMGMNKLASILRKTLIDVKISCCKHLNTAASLRALEPIQSQIKRLCLDCVWENAALSNSVKSAELNHVTKKRKCKRSWAKLEFLSLWIAVSELLTPLTLSGLEDCPVLEEIQIKVEGNCRNKPRPATDEFGLSSLACYPQLSKMTLNCGAAIGFALTAPFGFADLSSWERFYLKGIGKLKLTQLDYWPPQDTDVNQRSLTLPAAGLLAECGSLRKLFIHGTANEHFMRFLLQIPNLRDFQLREDYYPAPENDTSTEMREDSCSRVEDVLNSRLIPD